MPGLKLSLSFKIGLSNALMALLVFAVIGVSIFFTRQQAESAAQIERLSKLTSHDLPELVLDVKEVQINIIQVQQFLTTFLRPAARTASTTALRRRRRNAKEFADLLPEIRKLASKLGNDSIAKAVNDVEANSRVLRTRQKMARLYVAEGPSRGNKMMPEFGRTLREAAKAMESLIAIPGALSKQGQNSIDEGVQLWPVSKLPDADKHTLCARRPLGPGRGSRAFLCSFRDFFSAAPASLKSWRDLVAGKHRCSGQDDETGTTRSGRCPVPSISSVKTPFASRRWKAEKQVAEQAAAAGRIQAMRNMAETVERATSVSVGTHCRDRE